MTFLINRNGGKLLNTVKTKSFGHLKIRNNSRITHDLLLSSIVLEVLATTMK
jgi:hypothetical protein